MKAKLRSFFLFLPLLALLLQACNTKYHYIIVTPPNRALVINLKDTGLQASTTIDFEKAELEVGQITVTSKDCDWYYSDDTCYDALIFRLPGERVTRNFTSNKDSGTSSTNQAIEFEANGANGSIGFSATIYLADEDNACYLKRNKYSPAKETTTNSDDTITTTDSKFLFDARPIELVTDDHLIGSLGRLMSLQVGKTSPIELTFIKFEEFGKIKQQAMDQFHTNTCLTIDPDSFNLIGGIDWKQPEIQEQINKATVLAQQLDLFKKQKSLTDQYFQAFVDRFIALADQVGIEAAVELMKIEKWDGTFLPMLPGSPAVGDTPLPAGVVVPTLDLPAPTP